jgi:hypothetical protein
MKFYVGMHHPSKAIKVDRAFISVNVLANRKSAFPVNEWIMDSGAFTTIAKHGSYPEPVSVYANHIRKWKDNGTLVAAVAQDYMCEDIMLQKTGLTVADHQRLTIERYDALIAEDTGVYIMPVLQGYTPQSYLDHIALYGDRLEKGAYVGVGSVCKRNASPSSIVQVLKAIKSVRPDLRLHGFGVKTTALAWAEVRDNLESADSMAWSFAARWDKGNGNDWREAVRFQDKINRQAVQLPLFTAF